MFARLFGADNELTAEQQRYNFARNNAIIAVLVFFCIILLVLPRLTSAAVGGSVVLTGPSISGTVWDKTKQPSFPIRAYAIDWNDSNLRNAAIWKLAPDGNPNITVYVRPEAISATQFRGANVRDRGGVPYQFIALNASGQISQQHSQEDAYIYFSPQSVFETYVSLRREFDRKRVILEQDPVARAYYKAALSWAEAYLTEALGQDGSRVWGDFAEGVDLHPPGTNSVDAPLENNYSPIQFHLMPEFEDIYRFPILRIDGDEQGSGGNPQWGPGYNPLHPINLSPSQATYYTFVNISDSPLISREVNRGYQAAESLAKIYQTENISASYFVVKTTAISDINRGLEDGILGEDRQPVAGQDYGIGRVIQTDLASITFPLITDAAYAETFEATNPSWGERLVRNVHHWLLGLVGYENIQQAFNVDKNLVGWAWSDRNDENIRKAEIPEDQIKNDPNQFITATISSRAIYTGEKTLARLQMLQKPENAGAMPHSQAFYSDMEKGVINFQRFQGFELDVPRIEIGFSSVFEGFNIGQYIANLLREFANYLLAWSQPSIVGILGSNMNFETPEETGTDKWINRLVMGLNSPSLTLQDEVGGGTQEQSAVVNTPVSWTGSNAYTLGGFFRQSQMMAQVLLILFILWTCLKVITSDWTGNQVESLTELRDMIPRAFFVAIMIGLDGQGGGVVLASIIWWVNDVLCYALLDPETMMGFYNVFPISMAESPSVGEGIAFAILGILMAIAYIGIICLYILRAIAIWVLVIFMPWAWMCSISKTTQKFTQTWLGMWVATIGIQFLHAIMLLGFIAIFNTEALVNIIFGSVLQGSAIGETAVGAASQLTQWGAGYTATNYADRNPIWAMLAAIMMLFLMFRVTQSVFSQAMYSGRGALQMAQGMAKSALISLPMRRMMSKMMGGRGRQGGVLQRMRNKLSGKNNPTNNRAARTSASSPTHQISNNKRQTPPSGNQYREQGGIQGPRGGRPDIFSGQNPKLGGTFRPKTGQTLNPFNKNPNRPNAWTRPISHVIGDAVGAAAGLPSFGIGGIAALGKSLQKAAGRGAVGDWRGASRALGSAGRAATTGKAGIDTSIDIVNSAANKGWKAGAKAAAGAGAGASLAHKAAAAQAEYASRQQRFVDKHGSMPIPNSSIAATIADAHASNDTINSGTMQFMADSAAVNAMGEYTQDLHTAQEVVRQTQSLSVVADEIGLVPENQARALGEQINVMPQPIVDDIHANVTQMHLTDSTIDEFDMIISSEDSTRMDNMIADIVHTQGVDPHEAMEQIREMRTEIAEMRQNNLCAEDRHLVAERVVALLPQGELDNVRQSVANQMDNYNIVSDIMAHPQEIAGFTEGAINRYLS